MAGGMVSAGYGSSQGGLRPVTFEQFPGLDLKSAPDQSGCVDMLNCDITLDGNLSTRPGSVVFSTSDPAATSNISGLFPFQTSAGSQLLVAAIRDATAGSLQYFTINQVGTISALFNSLGGLGPVSAARLGTPTSSVMYLTNGTGGAPFGFVKCDGGAFSQPPVTVDGVAGKQAPHARFLATSPIDNRLVIAGTNGNTDGPNSLASTPSHVWFSDPGLPESYSSTNFLQLTPGDGETINGAVAWRELVFIFKASRFFVIYGTATDSTGKPVFNYRAIDTGAGALDFISVSGAGAPLCVAGTDAVYFANTAGIFKSTGGAAVKISTALDPLFQGGPSAFWQGGICDSSHGVLSLSWFNERLYVVLGTTVATASNMIAVYDPRQGIDRWVVWQVGTLQTVYPVSWSAASGAAPSLYFGHGKRVRVFSAAASDDAGTAIVSRYRSGFGFGGPDETTVRETILDGSGTPTLQWSRDWGSLVTGSAVTLGTAPAISVGRQRLAIRGRRFSWQIGANSGAWSLQRLQAQQRDLRESSVTV